jgi:C1A family cysteine protease
MYAAYKKVVLDGGRKVGTGWLPPMPDTRDFTDESPKIASMVKMLGAPKTTKAGALSLAASADLRANCSPVENQGNIGSCTAHAAIGVVEYYEKRAYGKHLEGSRLFVYKTTRKLMGVTGDTGAWLRNTMGALALCGVPEERYHAYTDADPAYDAEPSAFVYSIADDYEALKYFCHDPIGASVPPATVLSTVKSYIGAGIPSMFGFFGFGSFDETAEPGAIPFPCPGEQAEWGHAIVAVGYDDAKKVKNTKCNKTTTGALLIRNSWGTTWGAAGYGWLPYEYVLKKYAVDFWSLLKLGWIDSKQFHF